MENYFDELKQSLDKAVAFKNGDRSRASSLVRELPVPEYQAADNGLVNQLVVR
ncbi:MAG: hypothetical protein LBS96_05270 [Oscillospiraceae bacterium]|jgi:hypothetical protein|nr:hypothetical protein [Oscillospiraceae bacterium]